MTGFDSEAIRKAVEGGAEFIAKQQAEYLAEQAAEEARVKGLPADVLPAGAFKTKEEAEAHVRAAEAAGKFPQRFDDGTGNHPFVLEIDSPFQGQGDKIWVTAISDTDPNPPLHADMQPG